MKKDYESPNRCLRPTFQASLEVRRDQVATLVPRFSCVLILNSSPKTPSPGAPLHPLRNPPLGSRDSSTKPGRDRLQLLESAQGHLVETAGPGVKHHLLGHQRPHSPPDSKVKPSAWADSSDPWGALSAPQLHLTSARLLLHSSLSLPGSPSQP